MPTKIIEVGPKLYLNGFPKSGTHLLESMAICVMAQANPDDNWMGNFEGYGFTNRWSHIDTFPQLLEDMPHRRFVKGHAGWRPELAKSFVDNRWCKVFIYRDFRDVVVSTAYHSRNDITTFPNIEFYQSLEFDKVLKRIITGDENIDGVMDRWELYAPWLDEEWVLKLDFGDVVENKELACELFIRYLIGKTGNYHGCKTEIDGDYFNVLMHRMTHRLNRPERSATYRAGRTGDWEEHFTEEHKELFKESDKNNWLIRLGYENDRNW